VIPFARAKKAFVRLPSQLELNFRDSIVFADHHLDAGRMAIFGKAPAVNPTAMLKKLPEAEIGR